MNISGKKTNSLPRKKLVFGHYSYRLENRPNSFCLTKYCSYQSDSTGIDTQHNYIQSNDTQHNDTQHKGLISAIEHNDT